MKASNVIGGLTFACATFMLAPDILNRSETVCYIAAMTMIGYQVIKAIRNHLRMIRLKRASLNIRDQRMAVKRNGKVVNLKLRQKQRAICIPAYKVGGKNDVKSAI